MDTSVSQLYYYDICIIYYTIVKLREWGPVGSSAREALAGGYYCVCHPIYYYTIAGCSDSDEYDILAHEQIVYSVSAPV